MAAYNLYRGNGGKVERIAERQSEAQKPQSSRQPQGSASRRPPPRGGSMKLPVLGDLPKRLAELETEDLLLILILYLMYRESGDRELLIIMGAMYLL